MNNHKFTYQELLYTLEKDSTLNIVFVEGNRDMSFWRKLCPINDRIDSVVYSINDIDVKTETGGNKGRLINLATNISEDGFENRVKVFADADYDHLIRKNYHCNVVLTDWKDIESYALNENTINEIINTGLAKQFDSKVIYDNVCDISCSIGILRIVSEEHSLMLPFDKTFKKNGRKKVLNNNANSKSINILRLIDNLLQNANISLNQRDDIKDKYDTLYGKFQGCDVKYIAHGKDWEYFLAYFCGVEPDSIEPLVFLSMNYDEIKETKNISFINSFLTQHPLTSH